MTAEVVNAMNIELQSEDEWGTRPGFGPAAVISVEPPIIKCGIAYEEWLAIAGAFGRRYGNIPAAFLIYPTWSIESPAKTAAIGRAVRAHRKLYPAHLLVYMGNTQEEVDRLVGEAVHAIFLNKNFTVSEEVFRPLPDVEVEFDAIYNARFIREKRHELACDIERLAYIGYVEGSETRIKRQIDLMRSLLQRSPGHRLINPLVEGRPRTLEKHEVNRALNRAAVGIILSEEEGSNYASMEYMLAGLGVVSTASRGGRDTYFDDEFCLICAPDPAAVRAAVEELKARRIPRDDIRQRTLARVHKHRARFLHLVEDMRRQLGGPAISFEEWPFGDVSGMIAWDVFEGHLERFEQMRAISGGDSKTHSTPASA
jgi:glycosyltransferase involved in cell wall biosynthesis